MVNEEINSWNKWGTVKRQKRLKQAISMVEGWILKLLIFKETHWLEDETESSKTKRVVDTTETVLNTVKDVLEARNSDSFRQSLSQNIKNLSVEDIGASQYMMEQVEDSLSFVTDEKSGKMERQLYTDLKRNDARILRYVEKFSEFWIVFENEDAVFEELKLLCDWDSSLESWLQQQLFMLIKNYKAQKRETIGNIINGLQHKHHQ